MEPLTLLLCVHLSGFLISDWSVKTVENQWCRYGEWSNRSWPLKTLFCLSRELVSLLISCFRLFVLEIDRFPQHGQDNTMCGTENKNWSSSFIQVFNRMNEWMRYFICTIELWTTGQVSFCLWCYYQYSNITRPTIYTP